MYKQVFWLARTASPFPVAQWLNEKLIQCAYSSGTARDLHPIPF